MPHRAAAALPAPRPYRPDDDPAVVALFAALAQADPDAEPLTLGAWRAFVNRSESAQGQGFAVVEHPDDPGALIALLYALAPTPSRDAQRMLRHVRALVAPPWRRRGVATALLQYAARLPNNPGPRPTLQCAFPDTWDAATAFALSQRARPIMRERTLQRALTPLDGAPPPAPPHLRPYQPGGDDAAHWARLHNAAYGTTSFLFSPITPQDAATLAAQPGAHVWLALDDSGTPAGFCYTQRHAGGDGWIESIAVHPDAHRRGLARALMRAGLATLAAQGCARATLCVEDDNAPAIALYHAFGFAQTSGWTTYWLDGSQTQPARTPQSE